MQVELFKKLTEHMANAIDERLQVETRLPVSKILGTNACLDGRIAMAHVQGTNQSADGVLINTGGWVGNEGFKLLVRPANASLNATEK